MVLLFITVTISERLSRIGVNGLVVSDVKNIIYIENETHLKQRIDDAIVTVTPVLL